jgi:hypothetical protein
MLSEAARWFLKTADLEEAVSKRLDRAPNPSDEEFHDWAEGRGEDVDQAEAAAYRLASTQAKFREGGKANEEGAKPAEMSPAKLEEGAKIEAEHTPDKPTQRRIAADHIAELGTDYYPALKQLEERLKKEAAAQGFLDGYKTAAVDAEYSATAKPDRERLRQPGHDADIGAAEAVDSEGRIEADYARLEDAPRGGEASANTQATKMRELPWIKTRAQELDAANNNLSTALGNMLRSPQEKKDSLPFQSNMTPGSGIERSRRVVGSGVEA